MSIVALDTASLRKRARQCRQLADEVRSKRTRVSLLSIASYYDAIAAQFETATIRRGPATTARRLRRARLTRRRSATVQHYPGRQFLQELDR